MAAEADSGDVEEKYVTSCYLVMKTFGYTLQQLRDTPASTFHLLLEEMSNEAKREKDEMNKSKGKRFR